MCWDVFDSISFSLDFLPFAFVFSRHPVAFRLSWRIFKRPHTFPVEIAAQRLSRLHSLPVFFPAQPFFIRAEEEIDFHPSESRTLEDFDTFDLQKNRLWPRVRGAPGFKWEKWFYSAGRTALR